MAIHQFTLYFSWINRIRFSVESSANMIMDLWAACVTCGFYADSILDNIIMIVIWSVDWIFFIVICVKWMTKFVFEWKMTEKFHISPVVGCENEKWHFFLWICHFRWIDFTHYDRLKFPSCCCWRKRSSILSLQYGIIFDSQERKKRVLLNENCKVAWWFVLSLR